MTLLLTLLLLTTPADTLTLAASYRTAEANAPLRQTLAVQDAIAALRIDNLAMRYRPDLALSGQALYQSDVPSLPAMPGRPARTVSKDQYKVSLGVNQLVYDGGRIAAQQDLERVQRDLTKQETEAEIYQLREQVNAAYFGVLVQQARLASLRTLEEDLEAQLTLVQARVREGVVLASNADVLAVEQIKVEQQITEAELQRQAALAVLGTLLGRPLPEDVVLAVPELAGAEAAPVAQQRPEYETFELAQERLAQQAELAARRNRPQVATFAEASYGRPPGQNFFEDAFQPFYSLGVRVEWPVWDWRTSRRERQALALQQEVVQAREAAFTRQIEAAVERQRRDIERLEALLASDQTIIERRARITAQAASRLESGVITATDYLLERNAEQQARLAYALHRVQLAQARATYLTTIGAR